MLFFLCCVVSWFVSIRRELAEFLRDPPANCNAGPKEENNIYEWWSSIMGPEGSPYAKGIFFLNINFPEDYPFKPPKVSVTKTNSIKHVLKNGSTRKQNREEI